MSSNRDHAIAMISVVQAFKHCGLNFAEFMSQSEGAAEQLIEFFISNDGHFPDDDTLEELPARKAVEYYLPIITEYAEKLASLCQRASDILIAVADSDVVSTRHPLFAEATRLVGVYEFLNPKIEKLVHRTSSLLDLAPLPADMAFQLDLRQEELEAHFILAPAVFDDLSKAMGAKQIRARLDKQLGRVPA